MKVTYNVTDGVKTSTSPAGEFGVMVKKAREINQKMQLSGNSQVIGVCTVNNRYYYGVVRADYSDDEIKQSDLWHSLSSNNDTEIKCLLCMWSDGGFDMPSYTFRKLLCELDPHNAEAELMLLGQDCLIYRTVAHTFPKK